jgi:hypothetical protein
LYAALLEVWLCRDPDPFLAATHCRLDVHTLLRGAPDIAQVKRGLCFALVAAAPLILAAATLVGSTPDEEEFRFAILASTIHVRALAEGSWTWWSSLLGLGVPQPLVPNFHMHPLVPLLITMSPTTWARVLYLVHTLLGAAGAWQLGRVLSLTLLANAVCVFTFLLATPTQNYLLTDFWPSHYLVWTSAPWLLLFAWRFLEASGRAVWQRSLLLGVVAGLVIASTNPGHVVVYATVAAVVVATRWRAVVSRWQWGLVAAALALAISGPNHVQLAMESTVFDGQLDLVKSRDPLPPSDAWDVFLRPLSRSGEPWQADVEMRGPRTLFFGGPFAVLALAGLWLGRAHRDLVLGVLLTAGLLFTPVLPITFASRFHFRDPLTLCAIPLAGLALDVLLRSRRTRLLGAIAVVVQIGVVAAAAWPFLAIAWEPEARDAWWFRGGTGETRTVDTLLALMRAPGRLAYSPQVNAEVSERGLLADGLGMNALAYRGVSVVNGSFKGVSTGVVWPDDRLFYGRIRSPAGLIESDESLDLLGIRYVLANPGERVAAGLIECGTIAKRNQTRLILYENHDAWPGAFVLRGDARSVGELFRYPGCSNDRLLCKDLRPLAERSRPAGIQVLRQADQIDITLDDDTEPRLLILAEMFRPAWTATADDATLTTVSVGPGLLGVNLPPGTAALQLEYRPTLLKVTTMVAWSAMAGAMMALLVLSIPGDWRLLPHRRPGFGVRWRRHR